MIVDAALYTEGRRHPGTLSIKGAFEQAQPQDTFCWIGLFEPTEVEFAEVRDEFHLHELAVEDAISAHQRPKLEVYDDTLFVVLKPARYDDAAETVDLGEIMIFVSDDLITAVRHGTISQLIEVRRRLEKDPDELAYGPGAVLLEIIDQVVDDYSAVIEGLEDDIRQVEEDVFSDSDLIPTERIYRLKQQVLTFRYAAQPLLEPLDRLARGRFEGIHPELREYYRDVHDHLMRVVERVAAMADLLTSILEANLTKVSVRQNADMRKISAWVAMAAAPTMLAGIWGMNFDSMPELDRWWGYPAALVVMAFVTVFLYLQFKRSGWL